MMIDEALTERMKARERVDAYLAGDDVPTAEVAAHQAARMEHFGGDSGGF